MNMTKRAFLAASAGLAAASLAPMAAFAIGGDDPIEGIDVIVKKDPSGSKPIAPFSLTGDEMARFNRRQGRERADYLAGIIAMRIAESDKQIPVDELYEAFAKAMGESWCGPCRMKDGKIVNQVKVPWRDGGITALITAKF